MGAKLQAQGTLWRAHWHQGAAHPATGQPKILPRNRGRRTKNLRAAVVVCRAMRGARARVDRLWSAAAAPSAAECIWLGSTSFVAAPQKTGSARPLRVQTCLLYTSDAADE